LAIFSHFHSNQVHFRPISGRKNGRPDIIFFLKHNQIIGGAFAKNRMSLAFFVADISGVRQTNKQTTDRRGYSINI